MVLRKPVPRRRRQQKTLIRLVRPERRGHATFYPRQFLPRRLLGGLIERLNQTWGEPGEPGSVEEILHVCTLIRASLEQIVVFEERVYFTNGPQSYEKVLTILRDIAGSQADKLAEIPTFMDELLRLVEQSEETDVHGPPKTIAKTITLEAPEERLNALVREFKRAQGLGCVAIVGAGIFVWTIVFIF